MFDILQRSYRELQQLLSEKENLERTAAQQQAKLIELLHEQDVVEVKLLRLREVESELDQVWITPTPF